MQENTGVFEGRQTFLTFRDYPEAATQSFLAISREASSMCRTQQSAISNCENLPHIGWQLQSLHLTPGGGVWLAAAQAGNLSVANGAVVAPNVEQYDAFSQQTISGVTYAAGVQTLGFPMNVPRPGPTTNWSTTNLVADQAAYPSPATGEDYTPMNRMLMDTAGAALGQNILYYIQDPSSSITPRGNLANLYFNGPAGDPPPPSLGTNLPGSGQYGLKVRGDGLCKLFERTATDMSQPSAIWIPRYSFMWNYQSNTSVSPTLITLGVNFRMWQDVNGNWQGDRITFSQSAGSQTPGQLAFSGNLSNIALGDLLSQRGLLAAYCPPRITGAPISQSPVRIDMAIDNRGSFAAATHIYQSAGAIADDFVSFDQPVTTARNLTIVWGGVLPSGCSWSVQVFDQSGNLLTNVGPVSTSTTVNGQTSYQVVTPTVNMIGAQVVFTLNSNSGQTATPILTNYSIFGDPIYSTVPSTPVTIPQRSTNLPATWTQTIASLDITPQSTDPSLLNATVVVEDLNGALDFLENVNMIPVHCWMNDSNVNTNPSGGPVDLFRGYAIKPVGHRYRTNLNQSFPTQLATRWTLRCGGEWLRMMRATIPRRQPWIDTATGLPSKVTDVVTNLLQSVYVPSQVNVPTQPTRLFGTDPSNYISMPGARVPDLAVNLMVDYFGGWVIEDESAGTRGMMRGFLQRTPPYNNLAVFELDHPTILAGDNIPRIPQFAGSYPTVTAANGQKVQHIYMQGGTFEPSLEAAEGNAIVVFGGGASTDVQQATGANAAMLSQFAINVNSFNFLNLNVGDPGYPNINDPAFLGFLSPIRVFRYDLQTQAAVNYLCRRIYDRTCFARYFLAFDAPMITVIDVTDPLQVRPRKLRYYDPVMVRNYDGTLSQFLVVFCRPTYKKDRIQMARYYLVTQANINQRAVISKLPSDLTNLMRAEARIRGIDLVHSLDIVAQQTQGAQFNSEVMALPNPSGPPIQQLDPTQPGFGNFFFMSGFSITSGNDIIA